MRPLSSHILETLSRYGSPTICNVIELCNHRPRSAGYLHERIRSIYRALLPMVGYAAAVTRRSSAPACPDEQPKGVLRAAAVDFAHRRNEFSRGLCGREADRGGRA